jgi:uncharacterized membrane protein YccC
LSNLEPSSRNLSREFFARLIGALVGGVSAAIFGGWLATELGAMQERVAYIIVFGLLGILAGLVLTPYLTTRPLRRIRSKLISMPAERLMFLSPVR